MSQTEYIALLTAIAAVAQGAWMNITNWLDKRERRRLEAIEQNWKRERAEEEIEWRRETERYRRRMEEMQLQLGRTATKALKAANHTNEKLIHLGFSAEQQEAASKAADAVLAESIQ